MVGAANRDLFGRGPSPGFRFFLFAIVSIVLMYYDARHAWLADVRYFLNAAAYPIQVLVASPQRAWDWMSDLGETRSGLRAENAALKSRERELSVKQMRYEALERENARLRALRQATPPLVQRADLAEVISDEFSPLRQRLLINRGVRNGGTFASQSVVDARGLLGQVIRVGPWSAEVILITDPEHATPVEIVRNGLRSIAVGSGNTGELLLPYLPVNSDVKAGDLLVTSGLGGVFPAGYPVARVTGIRRDPVLLLAQVRAQPLATLTRDREVMLLWFDPAHPAAPARQEQTGTLPAPAPAAPPPPPRDAEPAAGTVKPAPAARPGGAATPPPATPPRPRPTDTAGPRPATGPR